jgi:hypothetical protein
MVWGDADSVAVRFIDSAMLNKPTFFYLRLCNNNWKLKLWISRNYPSWVKTHLIPDGLAKVKKEALDNENPLRITPILLNYEDPLKSPSGMPNVVSHKDSSNVDGDIIVSYLFSY